MLIKLSAKPNFRTRTERRTKALNRELQSIGYFDEDDEKFTPLKFDKLFMKTPYTGVYYTDGVGNDMDWFNCWTNQTVYYKTKSYKKNLKALDDLTERINFSRNAWDYGVADNEDQVINYYNEGVASGKFTGNHVITLTEIIKNPEHRYSGWRWHKNGPYIGTQNSVAEYINDEPEIERVVMFNIYKIV